jgi:hypothetical protein
VPLFNTPKDKHVAFVCLCVDFSVKNEMFHVKNHTCASIGLLFKLKKTFSQLECVVEFMVQVLCTLSDSFEGEFQLSKVYPFVRMDAIFETQSDAHVPGWKSLFVCPRLSTFIQHIDEGISSSSF